MEISDQYVEYFGVITGIIYLILEIRQQRAMWIVGFITSFTYVFVFFSAKFYADMGLNIYYVVISIYGFLRWHIAPKITLESHHALREIRYHRLSWKQFLVISGITALLYGIMYYILNRFTDSPVPAGDAFTTALSIVATWMLAQRIIEHWWFWVIINIVSALLYYQRELYPTCLLFICYAILAVVGWKNWTRKGVLYGGKL